MVSILFPSFHGRFLLCSVGRVNTELYALAAATWPAADQSSKSLVWDWMDGYNDVLCINSWQVPHELHVICSYGH